ncbi:isochorismatase family protein [Desulfogranum mediterraneum]|uniref:isochorismatase family protein n=1 Tax=Desulfogranum mediterraneum TaxID=160661 RepID=UPI0004038DB9|nr:isochorismatase family protein [Desulfogranum mediterraneum]
MDLEKTAIILIGYQNDYFAEDGILRAVIEESEKASAALANTIALIERLRRTAVHLISTPIIFTPEYSELVDPVGILKEVREGGAFKAGTKGAKTVPELVQFSNRIMELPGKSGLNAFSNTHLNDVLQANGVTDVVLAGVVSSICIDSTGRSAFERGYRVHILSDCTAGRTVVEQSFFCEKIFPLYAKVIDSSIFLAGMEDGSNSSAQDRYPDQHELDLQARYCLIEDLSRSKQRYQALIERLHEIVFQADDSFCFTFLNPAWTSLTDVPISEATGRSMADFVAEPSRDAWNDCIRELQDGAQKRLMSELCLHHPDGGYRWVTLFIEMDEPESCWTGSMHDITDSKRAEDALRESEERFRTIFETAQDSIFIKDCTLKYTQVNPAMEKSFGFSASSMIGMRDEELFGEESASDIREIDSRVLEGSIIEREHAIPVNGELYMFDIIKVPMRDSSGEISGLCGIARNISERKKAEKELLKIQKLKSIGTLAGGIAHDFNNILTGLFGNISLAKSKLLINHPAFRPLEKAETSMNRASHLASQLLTFAKGGEPVVEDVSLGELVEDVVRFDLTGSNVMPVFKQDEDLWLAKVDNGQIQQVISNLTTNANQAMPDGGRLYITLENAALQEDALSGLEQRKYIKLTVQDEGTGIVQEDRERIFDPYFSTKQTGSGLGLTTVYSIINKHGGRINVESEPGKGTTFTLYLPVSDLKQLPEAEQAGAEPSASRRSARIVVMDDDRMIRETSVNMLQLMGFEVESAVDGNQLIEMYKQEMDMGESFDVVIMDLTVPGGLGGKEAIKEILEIDPEVRAIVSSGYANDPVMANYSEYGFKDIVAKPYTISDLSEVLNRVLNNGPFASNEFS